MQKQRIKILFLYIHFILYIHRQSTISLFNHLQYWLAVTYIKDLFSLGGLSPLFRPCDDEFSLSNFQNVACIWMNNF